MKRKKLYILLTIILCLTIIICATIFLNPNSKFSAKKYVQKHQVELTQYAELMIKDNTILPTIYHGWGVSYYSSANMVQFIVSTFGIVPSMSYKGFYYSPEDKPLGFQGVDVEFSSDGKGWSCDKDGVSQYTEKMTDNWYWFEAKF